MKTNIYLIYYKIFLFVYNNYFSGCSEGENQTDSI